MKMSLLRLCLLALPLASMACSQARRGAGAREVIDQHESTGRYIQIVTETSSSSHTVAAPAHRVWTALHRVYEDLGVSLSLDDSANRRLGNTRFRQRRINGQRLSAFLDCGSGSGVASYANSYSVTMSLTTIIAEDADRRTIVQTQFNAVAEPRATSGNPLQCTSNGNLERTIVEKIAEQG